MPVHMYVGMPECVEPANLKQTKPRAHLEPKRKHTHGVRHGLMSQLIARFKKHCGALQKVMSMAVQPACVRGTVVRYLYDGNRE